MAISSSKTVRQYKSPLRCLLPAFLRSRNRWRDKSRRMTAENRLLCRQLQQAQQDQTRLQDRIGQLCQLLRRQTAEPTNCLAQWKKLPGHQFSAEMICLCCQLSLLIGIRAVPKVLACCAKAFDLPIEVPSRDSVRNWNSRNGVAILQEATHAEDWVWLIDHSVQLGKMFVLVVLGIRQSQLPEGRALCREDMTPLAVLPTQSRDKHEVARQLSTTAGQFGMPLAVLSDGASELHHGVAALQSHGFSGVHLDDIKHKIANLLKKRLRGNTRWQAFSTRLGTTTSAIQQTELEHLLPPRRKTKSRFMDFGRLIDWATMVEQQLTQVAAPEHARVVEKLGWISEFKNELQQWRQYRYLISQTLMMTGQQGVFVGASKELGQRLSACKLEEASAFEFRDAIISFYQHNEDQLAKLNRKAIRLPSSTEVLESAFGSFKTLQGNHGRGTFTSLLAVFATQFDTCNAAKIRKRFSEVNNRHLKDWLKSSGLTNSTQSRRTRAYANANATVTAFSSA